MSPRPYKLGLRLVAAEQTRARIIAAAREILSDDQFDGLSIDAIARRAGVARMTVYYQFNSRKGLLEALYDDIAARGLGEHFTEPDIADPREALERMLQIITRFWQTERVTIRRLRGLSVIDPEVEAGILERDQRRMRFIREVISGLTPADACNTTSEDAVSLIAGLTSFDTYDAIATACGDEQRAKEMVVRAVRAVLQSGA